MKKNIYAISGLFIVAICTMIVWLGGVNVQDIVFKGKEVKEGSKNYPADWAWKQRAFPNSTVDAKAQLAAIEEAKQLRAEQKLNKSSSVPEWEFAGPLNVGGRISDIEFNPNSPNIVYAAAATGGVFKSTDTGETWFPIFDDQAILPAGDIAVDPVNSDIVYVGTGEPNGGHNNLPGAGVFKSTDAGSTWQHIGLENTAQIGRIVINPVNTDIIYLAAVGSNFIKTPDRGVYKSTNGGSTWDKILFVSDSTGAIDITLKPDDPDVILAAMWQRLRRPGYSQTQSSFGPTSGIFKSNDAGNSWAKLGTSNGLPADDSGIGRIGLASSQSESSTVYSLYTDGGEYSGFYKSTNFGVSWVKRDVNNQISWGTSSFSWYFGQVRVDPTNAEKVFVLDVAFMRSTTSGNTWPTIYGYGGLPELHVDHHALAFHPTDPSYLISGNDGGINISTDGGITWSAAKHIPATQFYEIGLDRTNPERLYGGTQDNNTVRTTTGNLDDWEAILGGDGFYVNVDYTNPNYVYAESQWGNLYRSTNGGETFSEATNGIYTYEPKNWSTPVVMDPNNPSVLYYGTSRLYRSTNRAISWSPISDNLVKNDPSTPRYGTLTTIAVAPSNSDVIYIGTDDSKVWVTKDLGSTWTDISETLPFRWVTRVAVDPSNEAIVYATFSGLKWGDDIARVFRSTNYGEDWTNISGNLPNSPVNAIAIDKYDHNTIYIGSDVGVYYTQDLGANWEVLGTGLPIVSVYDMKIHQTENYLAVGTHGRSMYKLDLDGVTGIDSRNKDLLPESMVLYNNYPNPFNPTTKIKFTIPANASGNSVVKLEVFDVLGNLVSTIVDEQKSAGTYEVEFNAKGIASGTYFYTLSIGNLSETKKMILMK